MLPTGSFILSQIEILTSDVVDMASHTCSQCDQIRLPSFRHVESIGVTTVTSTLNRPSKRGLEGELVTEHSESPTHATDILIGLKSEPVAADCMVNVAPDM